MHSPIARKSPFRWSRRRHGFALLEALIAAVVVAFGLLAVARLQVALFGNSDVAKQRTEAVTLGEKKIEELRAYAQLPTDTATPPKRAYQDIASSNDTVTGANASYARTWTVTNVNPMGATYPAYKNLAMTVNWSSRTNTTESVTLNSMIALDDPAATGLASVPPGGTPTRKPKNRNINIPWPAVRIGNGVSAFHPPGAATGMAVIFDDVTAVITKTCTNATLPTSDNTTTTATDISTWGCTTFSGLLVAGFIYHKDVSNSLPINFHISVALTANADESGTATLFGCFDDIGTSGTGSELFSGYVTYSCVINTGSSGGKWSGTTTFSGTTFASPPVAVSWGTSPTGRYAVCRYVPANAVTYPYSLVDQTLEEQNYTLESSRNGTSFACPTDSALSYP